jgi:hypothetical protein
MTSRLYIPEGVCRVSPNRTFNQKRHNLKEYAKKKAPEMYYTKELYLLSSYFKLRHFYSKCAIYSKMAIRIFTTTVTLKIG